MYGNCACVPLDHITSGDMRLTCCEADHCGTAMAFPEVPARDARISHYCRHTDLPSGGSNEYCGNNRSKMSVADALIDG